MKNPLHDQGDDEDAKHVEELSCDAYSTNFLLERIEQYAQESGQPADLIRQKQEVGIYFGLFGVAMLAKDNWDKSASHPAVQTRLVAVKLLMKGQRSERAAAIALEAFSGLGTVWPSEQNPYQD